MRLKPWKLESKPSCHSHCLHTQIIKYSDNRYLYIFLKQGPKNNGEIAILHK